MWKILTERTCIPRYLTWKYSKIVLMQGTQIAWQFYSFPSTSIHSAFEVQMNENKFIFFFFFYEQDNFLFKNNTILNPGIQLNMLQHHPTESTQTCKHRIIKNKPLARQLKQKYRFTFSLTFYQGLTKENSNNTRLYSWLKCWSFPLLSHVTK